MMQRFDCRDVSEANASNSETIRSACDCFVKHGYAILDNVIAPEKMSALAAAFDDRYENYQSDRPAGEFMEVGDRRRMIPVELSGAFADPLVFANPYVVALARLALDPATVLEAFGAIFSMAGAERQDRHRDGPPLFANAISALLPAHALTAVFPLVEMNELHGTTAIWTGSHRRPADGEAGPNEAPIVPVGSCMMWDFRTYHGGTPNRSDRHRPMLYAVYSRQWYKDPVNYGRGVSNRLSFPKGFNDTLPEDVRALFSKK